MATALISDLHSNTEALTEVFKDIKANHCDQIYCLGDLVGYGPDPIEVVEMCYETRICLLGNHDEGVLKNSYGFNPIARQAIEWTRKQLQPGWLSGSRKKKIWSFLQSLPIVYKVDDILFVHASPRDPVMEYILRTDCVDLFGRASDKIADIFTKIEWLCFAGHTHDPGVITQEGQFIRPQECDSYYKFERGKRYIINVGSTGQPRDGDTRACYAIFDGESVRFRRVEYDYRKTMEKIFGNPDLDRKLGERLALGK
jgi:diadenosine tetraphosphatase ApaH/serine/threonine PP2A family protein phosphatase